MSSLKSATDVLRATLAYAQEQRGQRPDLVDRAGPS